MDTGCDDAGLEAAAGVVGAWAATFEHRLIPVYPGLGALDKDLHFVRHIRANQAVLRARVDAERAGVSTPAPSRPDEPPRAGGPRPVARRREPEPART